MEFRRLTSITDLILFKITLRHFADRNIHKSFLQLLILAILLLRCFLLLGLNGDFIGLLVLIGLILLFAGEPVDVDPFTCKITYYILNVN